MITELWFWFLVVASFVHSLTLWRMALWVARLHRRVRDLENAQSRTAFIVGTEVGRQWRPPNQHG